MKKRNYKVENAFKELIKTFIKARKLKIDFIGIFKNEISNKK